MTKKQRIVPQEMEEQLRKGKQEELKLKLKFYCNASGLTTAYQNATLMEVVKENNEDLYNFNFDDLDVDVPIINPDFLTKD